MPSSFDVNANVKLNSANLNASAKKIEMALGRITGQASEFQKSLDASTARVFAFGATTAVLNMVNQGFKKLVSTTIEVEKRLLEINSIFQASEKVFNRFRNSIFQVAKETGQQFNTVAEGAAELARQGLSAEETAKRLKAALVLTRISGLGAEKSVKALTAAINGFTSAGLTANQIVNKMVAVDTAFAVSAQDLAEAFSRAGSTAEDAGVSFNQLLGLVTAVEQKTARGGAVIGNAFKSIFTRLSRGDTIESLKELGVQIDSSQSGVQKLGALSAALEKISDPTVASKIKELAGGVFQINVVSAALKDLSSETSIYAGAAETAANATTEAFQKNAELNKSLSAQINVLIVGLTSLAERIGSITFGPLLQNLVGMTVKFTEFLDKALDPEKGNAFIQGLFKTIGQFLSGPAVVIFTTAFVKIFALVAKFAKDGLSAIFAIGSQTSKIKSVEAGIVGLLQKDKDLRNIILSSTASQAQKETAVIAAIRAENALLTQQSVLMNSIATAARARGVGGFSGATGRFSARRGMAFAGGFQEEEAMARSLGASNSVKAHFGQGTIGGRKFIMNSQETEIPNFRGGMDSAVIPMYPAGNPKAYGVGGGAAGAAAARKRKITRVLVDPTNYAFITPSKASSALASDYKAGHNGSTKVGGKPVSFQLSNRIKAYSPNLKDTDQISEPYDSQLYKKMSSAATDAAVNYGGMIAVPSGNKANRGEIKGLLGQKGSKGAYGAIRGAAGAAFEAAVTSAFGIQDFSKGRKFGDFDIRRLNTQGNGELAQTLGTGERTKGDLKVGVSKDTVASFIGKIIKERGGPSKFRSITTNKARGYIPKTAKGSKMPNFARGNKFSGKGAFGRDPSSASSGASSGDNGMGGAASFMALSTASLALNSLAAKGKEAETTLSQFATAASVAVNALLTFQTLNFVTGGRLGTAALAVGKNVRGNMAKGPAWSPSTWGAGGGNKFSGRGAFGRGAAPPSALKRGLSKVGGGLSKVGGTAGRLGAGALALGKGAGAAVAGTAGIVAGSVVGLTTALFDLGKISKGAADDTFFYGKVLKGSQGKFQGFFDDIFGVGKKNIKRGALKSMSTEGWAGSQQAFLKREIAGVDGARGVQMFDEAFKGKDKEEMDAAFARYKESLETSASQQEDGKATEEAKTLATSQYVTTMKQLGGITKSSLLAQEEYNDKLHSLNKVLEETKKKLEKARKSPEFLAIAKGAKQSAVMANKADLMGQLAIGRGPNAAGTAARVGVEGGKTAAANALMQKRALQAQLLTEADPDEREKIEGKIKSAGETFKKLVEQSSIKFANGIIAAKEALTEAEKERAVLARESFKQVLADIQNLGAGKKVTSAVDFKKISEDLKKAGARAMKKDEYLSHPARRGDFDDKQITKMRTDRANIFDTLIKNTAAKVGQSTATHFGFENPRIMLETQMKDITDWLHGVLQEKVGTPEQQSGIIRGEPKQDFDKEIGDLDAKIKSLNESIGTNTEGLNTFMSVFNTDEAKGMAASIKGMSEGLQAAAKGLTPTTEATAELAEASKAAVSAAKTAKGVLEATETELMMLGNRVGWMENEIREFKGNN